MESKTINGPVNVIRMEGEVGMVKKIIYLFCDVHENTSAQTKCLDEASLDISQYFASYFSNPDKIMDFMFEISDELIKKNFNGPSRKRLRYIENVMDLFIKNKNKNTNKNNKDNTNKNENYIRFHHIDVRDQLYSKNLRGIINDFSNIVKNLKNYYFVGMDMILKMEGLLKEMMKEIELFKVKLSDDNNKLIYKMKYEYKNKNVQNKIKNVFDYLESNINIALNYCSKILLFIEKFKVGLSFDKTKSIYNTHTKQYNWGQNSIDLMYFSAKLFKKQVKLEVKIIEIFALTMDIFFLRRFLDKAYIKNAIIYSGIKHSMIYIQVLLNLFDFKITHFSYARLPNIDAVNTELKKYKNLDENVEFEHMFYPQHLYQCSDISTFPKNFN